MRTDQLDKPGASTKRSPWLAVAIAVGVVLLRVIIHNAHIAQYFQTIFEHDWDHLAHRHTTDD